PIRRRGVIAVHGVADVNLATLRNSDPTTDEHAQRGRDVGGVERFEWADVARNAFDRSGRVNTTDAHACTREPRVGRRLIAVGDEQLSTGTEGDAADLAELREDRGSVVTGEAVRPKTCDDDKDRRPRPWPERDPCGDRQQSGERD